MPRFRKRAKDRCPACVFRDKYASGTAGEDWCNGMKATTKYLCTCSQAAPEVVEAVRLTLGIPIRTIGGTSIGLDPPAGHWVVIGPNTQQQFMSNEDFEREYEAVDGLKTTLEETREEYLGGVCMDGLGNIKSNVVVLRHEHFGTRCPSCGAHLHGELKAVQPPKQTPPDAGTIPACSKTP